MWLVVLAFAGCKEKPAAQALEQNDGKGTHAPCKLSTTGRLTSSATIRSGCVVAFDTTTVIAGGATLTIEQGARLTFARGARLVVEDGVVHAQGRKTNPIVFTSAQPQPAPGDWGGLVFQAEKASLLDNVVVEWAGDEAASAAPPPAGALADRRPAVYVAPGGHLALVESVIRHARRVGVAADGDAPFTRLEGVQLVDDGGFAMDVTATALGRATNLSASEPVRVHGAVKTSLHWPKAEVVVASLDVVADEPDTIATLTLAPETVLRVEPKATLQFGHRKRGGALVGRKVTFTSAAARPAAGDWAGLQFGDASSGTLLEDCVVEYAGYEATPPSGAKAGPTGKTTPRPRRSAVLLGGTATNVAIERTSFRHNAGPGMGKVDALLLGGFGDTGGCHGLDAPTHGNTSLGQPLCEFHEDPLFKATGAQFEQLLGDGPADAPLTKGNVLNGGLLGGVGAGGPPKGLGSDGASGIGNSGGGADVGKAGGGAKGGGGDGDGGGKVGGGGGKVH